MKASMPKRGKVSVRTFRSYIAKCFKCGMTVNTFLRSKSDAYKELRALEWSVFNDVWYCPLCSDILKENKNKN